MRFTETWLAGAFIVDLEEQCDARGFFVRTFCAQEFGEHGLRPAVAQCSFAMNHLQGTLRGLHYQVPPAAETKLIRCVRGAIYDVVVDMRPESATYLQHLGVELTAENRRSLYIPQMFAHGYLTLVDQTEVLYQMSDHYMPGFERGLRYDDPSLDIVWPLPVRVISEKDANWPLLSLAALPSRGTEEESVSRGQPADGTGTAEWMVRPR